MKKINFIFLISSLIILSSCKKEYTFNRGFTQGTTYAITYQSVKGTDYHEEIKQLLEDFDFSLSTYNDSSVISKINRNESNHADEHFTYVYHLSKEIAARTDTAFDITIGPLVNAFGFGPDGAIAIDSAVVDSILDFTGYDKFTLQDGSIQKLDPRVKVDMNAIAQGYSVDLVAGLLEDKGIKNYLVEIGGEVRARGLNPKGKTWRIGIDKPMEGNNNPGQNLQAIIQLKDKALATSGNYRKFYEKDGVKYAHIIDPQTGYPALRRMLSATVITDKCIEADALATSFMVMGLEKTKKFLEENTGIQAYLIYSDKEGNYQVYSTEKIKGMITEIESSPKTNH